MPAWIGGRKSAIRILRYTKAMSASAAPAFMRHVGQTVRDVRLAVGWSQRGLARRSGVSQSVISRLETHRTRDVRMSVVDRLLVALGVRYWLGTEPPNIARRPTDLVHGRCSAHVARRLIAAGWQVEREVEVIGSGSHGWIDVLAFEPNARIMLVIEVKTELLDVGAIERSLNWYVRESRSASRRLGWRPDAVASALLVLESAMNDERLSASADVFRIAFPGRATGLRAVIARTTSPLERRYIAMIDPSSRRATWLRATRADGRRTGARYVDYIDAVRSLETHRSA